MPIKTRQQLKSFFVKNAIPTEGNFADLIDSPLSQSEDGVFKVAGEPLSVVAAPDNQRRALRLYSSFPAVAPDWQVNLNPAQTPGNPATSRLGFGVTDGAGNVRLFIDAASGALGVGTNAPEGALDVRVSGALAGWDRLLVTSSSAWGSGSRYVTLGSQNGLMIQNPHVPWLAAESRASIRYGLAGGVANGGSWDVGMRPDKSFSLLFNNTDPRLTVQSGGNVGVGTTTPEVLLDVAGTALVRTNLEVRGWASLGFSQVVTNLNLPLAGGFFSANNPIGAIPDSTSAGSHMIAVRSGNPAEQYQLQLASSFTQNNRLFFRKIARSDLQPAVSPWNELVALSADNVLRAPALGINAPDPGGLLDVRIPGTAVGADRFVVSASNAYDGTAACVTIGGGAFGLMLNNPIVPWLAADQRASIRYGRAGGVASGNYWDLGLRPGNAFTLALNGKTDHKLVVLDSGNVGIGVAAPAERLEVLGSAIVRASLAVWDKLTAGALTVNSRVTTNEVAATGSITSASYISAPSVNFGTPVRTGVRMSTPQHRVTIPPLPASIPWTAGFTIQAWIYLNSIDANMKIVDLSNGPQNDNISLGIGTSGRLIVSVTVLSTATEASTPNDFLVQPRTWTHVAVTVGPDGVVRFYKNGSLASTQPGPLPLPRLVQRTVNYIGRSSNVNDPYWNGALAEVSLWTGVRPIVPGGFAGNDAGMIGYWRLSGSPLDHCSNVPHIGDVVLSGDGPPTFGPLRDATQSIYINQDDWTPITLINGWYPTTLPGFNPPGYFKDSFGVVHLRGVISTAGNGYVSAVALPICTLPGARPQYNELLRTICFGNALGRVDIDTMGNVYMQYGHSYWNSLDGLTYRAYP